MPEDDPSISAGQRRGGGGAAVAPRHRSPEQVKGAPRSAPRSLWRTHREPAGFLMKSVREWAAHYFSVAFSHRHPFRTYAAPAATNPGIFELPGECAVALAGDWGTGTGPAEDVARRIQTHDPQVTIHLGDVYYSGTPSEFRDYFLSSWPRGSLRTMLLNANHEMYSGGYGYFGLALPDVGQEASYFCLENDHWRIVGVDTGYFARHFPLLEFLLKGLTRLPDENVAWLEDVVFRNRSDRRPVILLSHHAWFSAFDTEYGGVGRSVSPFLDRVLLWLWAHEHRFAGYGRDRLGDDLPVRARCIGHGGMPIELKDRPKRKRNLVFYDARAVGRVKGDPVGACGYAVIEFAGPKLTIQYGDQFGATLLVEEWDRTSDGARGRIAQHSTNLTWLLDPGVLVA
jgi:Calcineurin-like phosphoesterase